jgi:hypothetical protein
MPRQRRDSPAPATGSTDLSEMRAAIFHQIATSPHLGTGQLDRDIRRSSASKASEPSYRTLGWLVFCKGTEKLRSGFYKLAEQCALRRAGQKSPRRCFCVAICN